MPEKSLISIITVCFNDKENLIKTIKSVLGQTFPSIEYLIIDGGSEDGTREILKQYSSNPVIRVISEKDNGIYNAMNKGVAASYGKYINFMNSGDTFFSCETIRRVVACIENHRADIYYGKVNYIYPDGERTQLVDVGEKEAVSPHFLMTGNMPNHQTMFIRRELLTERYFNEGYKIRADYDWFVSCCMAGCRVKNMRFPICNFQRGGISNSPVFRKLWQEETCRILKKQLPFRYWMKNVITFYKEMVR